MGVETVVYVHVPFCREKCRYCGYFSVTGSRVSYERYVEAVLSEWEYLRQHAFDNDRPAVRALYVGGGTPSLLGADLLRGLLSGLLADLVDGAEVTVEVNPEHVGKALLEVLAASGCNRLSLGVQSLDPEDLARLGRGHTLEDARAALEAARKGPIQRVNVDLIFGIPGQSVESWEATLREVLKYDVTHLSCYMLVPDEDTMFERLLRGTWQDAHVEEIPFRQSRVTQGLLEEAGFTQYQPAYFARPSFECIYAEMTASRAPCLGLGAGAYSFDGSRRWRNWANVEKYAEAWTSERRVVRPETLSLGPEDEARETLILGLRRRQGVDLAEVRRRVGEPAFERLMRRARFLAAQGFVAIEEDRLRVRQQAFVVTDSVVMELLRALEGAEG